MHEMNIANRILSVSGSLDVKIDVVSVINSEEVVRNDSQVILDRLSAPSVLQQFGIVGPEALHKAISDWMRAYNKDPEDYGILKPVFVSKPLTLFQEIQACGQGVIPPMSMRDDHFTKAQQLVAFLQEPSYLQAKAQGMYIQTVDEWVMKTANKHAELAKMMEPKGQNQTGINSQNQNQLEAGQAPQQGGVDVNRTTSRDLGEGNNGAVRNRGMEDGSGAGGETL